MLKKNTKLTNKKPLRHTKAISISIPSFSTVYSSKLTLPSLQDLYNIIEKLECTIDFLSVETKRTHTVQKNILKDINLEDKITNQPTCF